jgi:hypothetical protein
MPAPFATLTAFLGIVPAAQKRARLRGPRLRRAQTFLRVLGIDIAFSRVGNAGNRIIRTMCSVEDTVSTVSTVCSRDLCHAEPALQDDR